MTALPRDYDQWRLSGPDDEPPVGMEDGDTCYRLPEPDEDAPRNWRPRPCGGLMMADTHGDVVCESCGATASTHDFSPVARTE
jgi:hypothetical protein